LFEGETIDLKVRPNGVASGDATALADYPIATPIGRVVPLSSVASIERTVAPQEIQRVGQQRAVTLSITLPDGLPLEAAVTDINSQLDQLRAEGVIPSTVVTTLAGSAARLSAVQRELLGEWRGLSFEDGSLLVSSLFLALVVVFLLMAALFESFFYPLVIMFSVPLATVGGFAGLAIVNYFVPSQQLDVLTMLGFVILIGIVVNNAILLVHQSLNLMRGGAEVQIGDEVVEQLSPRLAIVEAVRSRVRPILMAMCTSVGGMLPLVILPGAGTELYRGLGSVVIGGLIVAAIFTLILVPLMLSVVFDLRAILFRLMGREQVVEQAAL
ncbi:MAG: efflux RND transporter permease subunit, partial [Phycisphaeraceae bacterium]